MQNYRLDLAYDGTRYEGWQRQKRTENTIQGKIEAVLSKMEGRAVEINGAGRTDAGVHARGQVANVHLATTRSADEICAYLNRYLPEDIGVNRVCAVDERFHARLSAVRKQYCYRIETGLPKHVFDRKYIWHYTEQSLRRTKAAEVCEDDGALAAAQLDVARMRAAADLLVGRHDFRSFCGNKNMKKSTVRCIERIDFAETKNELAITYTGDGFLQYMIRILTGTLLECGSGRRRPEEMEALLAACDREQAGFTAPACGLTLMQVWY